MPYQRWTPLAVLLCVACADATPHIEELGAAVPLTGSGAVEGLAAVDQAVVVDGGRLLIKEGDTPIVVDVSAGTVDTLGRTGRGPGEYSYVQAVAEVDGHLAALAGGWRLILWDLSGRFVRESVVRSDRIEPATVRLTNSGAMYGSQLTGSLSSSPKLVDTIPIMRGGASPLDTVLQVVAPAYSMSAAGPRLITSVRFAPVDAWGVLRDGTLWHARAADLRVGRRASEADEWVWSPMQAWSPVPTTPADVEYFAPDPDFPGLDTIPRPMAEAKGPIEAAVAADDGTVWVQRAVPAGSPVEQLQRYPSDGGAPDLVATVPRGRRVVAATDRHLYTALEETSGLWVLERWEITSGMK